MKRLPAVAMSVATAVFVAISLTSTASVCAQHSEASAVFLSFVQCPDKSSCPDGYTCCPSAYDPRYYGCCPTSHGSCCADGIHCCPYGYKCNSSNECYTTNSLSDTLNVFTAVTVPEEEEAEEDTEGDRNESSGYTIPALMIETEDPADSVDCPDGSSCPNGTTCCPTSYGYGCCGLKSAVCCADTKHCCPYGYWCDPDDPTECIGSAPYMAHPLMAARYAIA